MKLLLLADGAVGLSITKYLIESYLDDLSLVVTIGENEIYFSAKEKGIPVCIFDSTDGVVTKLKDGVDLGVLAWWPKILKSPLLEAPHHGFVNTHPSLLPYNKGKHYNFWALVEQSPFGVTIHRVDSGVDTGDIVAQKEISYDWCDNGGSLYYKAQEAMVSLFGETYPIIRTGHFDSKTQCKEVGSYHHSLELKQASNIDLEKIYRGRDLVNLLRAKTFEGHPGCWFEDKGNRYEIFVNIKKVNL